MKEAIKIFQNKLKQTLLGGGSINDQDLELWTFENFKSLHNAVNSKPIKGSDSFQKKVKVQIEEATDNGVELSTESRGKLLQLMLELLSLYYVFPSNISAETKRGALVELLNNESPIATELGLTISNFDVSLDAIMSGGIGSGGMGINTNKQKEVFYLIDVFKAWYERNLNEDPLYFQQESAKFKFQDFIDEVAEGRSPQCRHVLLHIFFPDYFEPIISSSQKSRITQVFSGFCSKEDLKTECNEFEPARLTDQKIKVISNKLAELRGKPTYFYDEDLASFWDINSEGTIPNLDPELLEYKKQIVLYGPPGTSKTYTAKILASEIIRYRMAKDMGASILQGYGQERLTKALKSNIHQLQLHPAYSYEDFVRGLQFIDGNTVYKDGYLLELLENMMEEPELPHVLILDEINRVDLSRLFGECFSAIENRGEAIDLPGSNQGKQVQLKIPNNLYLIGTMNLIDHSVEQLDFALRRRFLWLEASYNGDALLEICKSKWNDLKWESKSFSWETVDADFQRLVSSANNLNEVIREENELGNDFVLGHVFFVEAVPFLHQFLQPYSRNPGSFLFTSKGSWREPIEKLWKLSLNPLIQQYLSGLDNKTQIKITKQLKEAFKP